MTIPMDRITSMPAFSPYYPPPPVRYRNARFQFVFFRADVAAVDRVLPACLEPAEDGYCVAIGISIPWASSYGAFDESVLTVKCTFRGETGYFAPVAFLNSRSSIPAGREIYGTPKVFAEFECGMDERVAYTDTRLAGASVLAIRSTFHREARVEELPDLTPSWRLKAIPRVDGRGADVLQLIDGAKVTSDVDVHVCRAGDGVIQCDPSPIYNLADFTPREYYGAFYLEQDYTEGYGEVVHDFLNPA